MLVVYRWSRRYLADLAHREEREELVFEEQFDANEEVDQWLFFSIHDKSCRLRQSEIRVTFGRIKK